MRRLKKYKDGNIYVTGGMASIEPNEPPIKEYDLSILSDEEFNKLKRNPKDKKLLKKAKRIYG